MARKKWEIPDVPAEQDVVRVAQTILALHLPDALALVDEFRASHAEKSLHQLRIALRRFHYPVETLLGFFPRRTGLRFLRALNALPQSAGDGREGHPAVDLPRPLDPQRGAPGHLNRLISPSRVV